MKLLIAIPKSLQQSVQSLMYNRLYQMTFVNRPLNNKGLRSLLLEQVRQIKPDALILDIDLIDQKALVELLRKIRLALPGIHVIILSHHPDYLNSLDLELSALHIFDRLDAQKSTSTHSALIDKIIYRLHHPTDLLEYLKKETSIKTNRELRTRQYIAIGSLSPQAGVTKLSLSLGLFLANKGPVLLIEAAQNHVYEQYFFTESDFDPNQKTYQLSHYSNLDFLSQSHSKDWVRHINRYDYVIHDLGLLSEDKSPQNWADFWRANHSLLVSKAAPWDLAKLEALGPDWKKSHLWLSFCSENSFTLIKKRLHKRFSTLICTPYQPDLFKIDDEQNALYQQWCERIDIV